MRCIAFVGGGSVGHLAPCVAVREELLRQHPEWNTLMICSDAPEDAAYLELEGIHAWTIPLPRRTLTLPRALAVGFARALRFLRQNPPDVVFSKGGAVSIPVCFAAWVLGIPVILHESDAEPGRASRFLARFAVKVCLGFTEAQGRFPKHKTEMTGNPTRRRILMGSKVEGLRLAGFTGEKPVLLILGGSQGALELNHIVVELLPHILSQFDVIHITGKGKELPHPPHRGYVSRPFVHGELPHFLSAATLAVSRAGAGSIAELAACSIPAILVPLEGVAQNHQWANAKAMERQGGFLCVRQKDLPVEFFDALRTLQGERPKRDEGRNATQRIMDMIRTEIALSNN